MNRKKTQKHSSLPEGRILEDFLEEDISVHVFSVSSAMVGVCLTAIGIIRLIITTTKVQTFTDDLLSLTTLLFLSACGLSYFALRTRRKKRHYRVEKIAEAFFLIGLLLIGVVCFLITYQEVF